MTASIQPISRTMNLTPSEELELLSKVNNDVLHFMKDFLYEYGQIFGSRVYDEAKINIEEKEIWEKIMMGIFGTWSEYNPYYVPLPEPQTPFLSHTERVKAQEEHEKKEEKRIKKEKKQRKIDEGNYEKSKEILNTILKERNLGVDTLYMNYVLVLYVKANVKSCTSDIGCVRMFRFAKNDKHDRPSDNFFIGSDLRLYKNWADFMDNNQIPHNCLILAPSEGAFTFSSGSLHLDIFHVTRYVRTYVDPILTSIGLVGTGMLCASLPPVGLAVGIGASGVGAIGGITRGIIELFDRSSHNTLMRTSSLIPTIDILSNLLFAHSAVGALRATSLLNSQKFMTCILFTENAFRIGAVSRLSLDILSTIIAFAHGQLDFSTMAQRLFSSCIFLYNVGLNISLEAFEQNFATLACSLPSFLTYENIQPFIRLAENFIAELPGFDMIENLQEFTGLFSVVLHNIREGNRLNFGNLTQTLQRLMNVKWNLISEDLRRCKEWVDMHFTPDEHMSNFRNIQLAVVYNLHETLKKFVHCDDRNISEVEYNIKLLMKEVIQLWKRMFTVIYPDQNPDVRQCTMIMRYLINKIDWQLRHNIDLPSPASPSSHLPASASTSSMSEVPLSGGRPPLLPCREVYACLMGCLIHGDIYEMSAECSEMIARKELEPIRHVVQHRYASVCFIEQQSTNDATEEIYEDSNGNPTALSKVDPVSKLGVLIKYTLH